MRRATYGGVTVPDGIRERAESARCGSAAIQPALVSVNRFQVKFCGLHPIAPSCRSQPPSGLLCAVPRIGGLRRRSVIG